MSKIFISYRRDDARGWAKGLYDVLAGYFGNENVFYDRRTIQGGDEWFRVISDNISDADAVLVLIGPDWTGANRTGHANRLLDPADVVRREVELALTKERWIVPVLLENIAQPDLRSDQFPESLRRLASIHMVPIRPDIFDEDSERLLALLRTRLRDPGRISRCVIRQRFDWLIRKALVGFAAREPEITELKEFLENPGRSALLGRECDRLVGQEGIPCVRL